MTIKTLLILALLCVPAYAQVAEIEGDSKPYLNQQLRRSLRRLNEIENYTINSLTGTLDANSGGTGIDSSAYTSNSLWTSNHNAEFSNIGVGTSGQYLQSQGANEIAKFATVPTVTHAYNTASNAAGGNCSYGDIVSQAKTITSGNVVLVIATGVLKLQSGNGTADIKIIHGVTTIQEITGLQMGIPEHTFALSGIVTGISGATTFKMQLKYALAVVNADCNLTIIEIGQ